MTGVQLGLPNTRLPNTRLNLVAVVLFAVAACKGPPARLVAGIADTVVANNVGPVQMPMHVFDAAGHVLPDTGVRYRRTSGALIPVSDRGGVKCTQAGDVTLRASLGRHSLQLPPSPPTYSLTMLPDRDTLRVPRLAMVGANCDRGFMIGQRSYWCFALHGASVVAYHPKGEHPREVWSGTIAV